MNKDVFNEGLPMPAERGGATTQDPEISKYTCVVRWRGDKVRESPYAMVELSEELG